MLSATDEAVLKSKAVSVKTLAQPFFKGKDNANYLSRLHRIPCCEPARTTLSVAPDANDIRKMILRSRRIPQRLPEILKKNAETFLGSCRANFQKGVETNGRIEYFGGGRCCRS